MCYDNSMTFWKDEISLKNYTFRLMYQTAYFTLSIIAFLASLGLFRYDYYDNWYIHFTNLSNYFCMCMMGAELVETVKHKERPHNTVFPKLKYMGVIMILLTFCVFNFMLAGAEGRNPADNFAIASVLLHIVLPILFIGDWVLFYERKQVKWYDPLLSLAVPLIYVGYILIRAPFVTLDPTNKDIMKYPYFFLNVDEIGWGGLAKWVGILMIGFVAVGYLLVGLDRLPKKK